MNFIIGTVIVCFVIPQTYQEKQKQKQEHIVERIIDNKNLKEATSEDFKNSDGEPLMVKGVVAGIDKYIVYNRNEDGTFYESDKIELTVESEVIKRFKVSSGSCSLIKDKEKITKIDIIKKQDLKKKQEEYEYIAFEGDEPPKKITKEVLEQSERIKKNNKISDESILKTDMNVSQNTNEVEIIGADGKKYHVSKSLFSDKNSFKKIKELKESENTLRDEALDETILKEDKINTKEEKSEVVNYDVHSLLEKQVKKEKEKEKEKEETVAKSDVVDTKKTDDFEKEDKKNIKTLKKYDNIIDEAFDIMLHKD